MIIEERHIVAQKWADDRCDDIERKGFTIVSALPFINGTEVRDKRNGTHWVLIVARREEAEAEKANAPAKEGSA